MSATAASQTPLWLTFGVIFGAAYSLSADHYARAQTHHHLFVRAAMLGLSAAAFLASASAIGYVCYRIRTQDHGLDGVERVFSVLIPVVVRADLIVDWGKRVTWAVFLAPAWTQSCVSLRRIARRAHEMAPVLDVDADVAAMARGGGATAADFPTDMARAEDAVWADGAESLARLSEMFEHMRKLARVSAYAAVGLVGAVPGAVVWVGYAANRGVRAWNARLRRLAALYWVSVLFAPVGAVVVMFVSAFAFVGIVSLSVVGACVAFTVHWSTRMVYSVLRLGLSQLWADFPFLMRREGAVASLIANAEKLQHQVVELPAIVGKQVIDLPALVGRQVMDLPGHIGSLGDRSSKPAGGAPPPPPPQKGADAAQGAVAIVIHADEGGGEGEGEGVGSGSGAGEGGDGEDCSSAEEAARGGMRGRRRGRRRVRERADGDRGGPDDEVSVGGSDSDEIGLYHGMHLARHPDEAGAAIAHMGILLPTELEFALASWDGARTRRGYPHISASASSPSSSSGEARAELDGKGVDSSASMSAASLSPEARAVRAGDRRDRRYLARLGLDEKVDTPAKRRLTTYWCLGMLVQLQVSSGGNSWLVRRSALRAPAAVDVDQFVATITALQSTVAVEAAEACLELAERMYLTPKYRVVPSGGRNIEVGTWVRAVLLILLGEPGRWPAWVPADGAEPPSACPSLAAAAPALAKALSAPMPARTQPPAASVPGGATHELRHAWSSPLSSTESAKTSAGGRPGGLAAFT